MIRGILETLLAGRDLARDEAQAVMDEIMAGRVSPPNLAALLVALRAKGETATEITGFAAAMREHAVQIHPRSERVVDTCGTGGDGQGTFNISTATALVVAAMGVPVAKHGNRAVSSRCGSADLLEALDVNLDLAPDRVAELVDEVGIGFLFAPALHPAMKHAVPVRRELGLRTVFNLLGPLTNPAGVKRQLLGVYAPELTAPLCEVLRDLGSEKAFVVHGADGGDEVSLCGPTRVSALAGGDIRTYEFTPEEAGLRRAEPADLRGGDAETNAEIVRGILAGRRGPQRDAVLLNAGFAAIVADRADTVAEGIELARGALDAGHGEAVLENLRRSSRQARPASQPPARSAARAGREAS